MHKLAAKLSLFKGRITSVPNLGRRLRYPLLEVILASSLHSSLHIISMPEVTIPQR